jgi:hypothetical protein
MFWLISIFIKGFLLLSILSQHKVRLLHFFFLEHISFAETAINIGIWALFIVSLQRLTSSNISYLPNCSLPSWSRSLLLFIHMLTLLLKLIEIMKLSFSFPKNEQLFCPIMYFERVLLALLQIHLFVLRQT